MPYFVYRISPDRKTLDLIDAHERFRDAKNQARDLRKAQEPGDAVTVRVIFAQDRREAEVLLKESHKPSSPLEEWEG
ncbi:MAG: hypothetical protein OEZ10_12750 [Gammaproteobacteria bacterium]|nr:hypothetical protein [Gammaproteobacteria bacterium]